MARTSKFSPEVRDRAVRMVLEHLNAYASRWAAIKSIAEKIACSAEALRNWVAKTERDQGQRPGLTTDERQRLKDLEREVFELRRANEILKGVGLFRTGGVRPPFATLTWVAWFNVHRLLEGLGYVPPAEFEQAYYSRQPTAAELATVT